MESKRLHDPAEAAGPSRRRSPGPALKNGSRLLVEGSWLFNQFEDSLIKSNMELLRLRPTAKKRVMANMADETWLDLRGRDGLAQRMMKNRILVLEEMYAQFYGWAGVLGWDERITKDIADTVMPFLDIWTQLPQHAIRRDAAGLPRSDRR